MPGMDKRVEAGLSEFPEKPLRTRKDGVSLKASLGYSFVGQAFYLVSQLGVLSALAHFQGATAVGEFGLALALATPLFLLMNMGFRTAQAVDVDEIFSFAEYGGTRIVLTIVASVACILLATFYLDRPSTFLIVVVVVLAKAFESISNLAYGAFQQGGRMDFVAISFAIRGSATIIVFVGLLMFGASTAMALSAQLVVWAVVAVFFDYPRASRLIEGKLVRPRLSIRQSWSLLVHSAPLGGGLLANSLQMTATRLMVERFLGLDALGLFTAVGYFQQAGVTASNSISNAIVNRFARLSRNDNRTRLRKIVIRLLVLFVAAGAAGIATCYFFGDVILKILFGSSYLKAEPLLLIISIVVSLRIISTLPQSLLFAEQRYKEFLGFQLAALSLVIVLGLYLIPSYGVLGAGYVLLAVAAFRLLVLELVMLLRPRGKSKSAAPAKKDRS
jgi:O-antigen/teichoic acid export membrane protein